MCPDETEEHLGEMAIIAQGILGGRVVGDSGYRFESDCSMEIDRHAIVTISFKDFPQTVPTTVVRGDKSDDVSFL